VSAKTVLEEVAEFVVKNQFASASTIQRKLRIGFAMAQRSLSQLEQIGVVGPKVGTLARDVLVTHTQLLSVLEKVREFEAVNTDG
jgi:DNA segregation ATPase FtsK/SpoIIIE-like protein